jgi:hypothetical protein
MNPNELNPNPPRVNDDSPWGPIEYVERWADGIYRVQTPSHGGCWISPERAAEMPAWTRKIKAYAPKPNWWEEDAEILIVLHLFADEMWKTFDESTRECWVRLIKSIYNINLVSEVTK